MGLVEECHWKNDIGVAKGRHVGGTCSEALGVSVWQLDGCMRHWGSRVK